MWTLFWDMHSGGGLKEKPYDKIYIEASEDEAKIIFYNRFGHNPERVTCTCCGEDYSIDSGESLEGVSGYHRGCDYVYRDPDGNECSRLDGFTMGVGTTAGYSAGHEERPSSGHRGEGFCGVEEYVKRDSVLIVRADDIEDDEREGDVPDEGYYWA